MSSSSSSNNTTTSSSEPPKSDDYEIGTFSFQHFIIILLVFAAMIFISFSLVQLRVRIKNSLIDRIPRKIMPFLRPGDLSEKQRSIILNQLVKSKQTQSRIQPPIGDSPIGHLGWGAPGSEYAKVHFKTSISKSWIILERAATHYNPTLKRESKLCIRDYVQFLQQSCPHIEKSIFDLYIDYYEKARFSEEEFTLDEYSRFMSKFLVLVQGFNSEITSRET
eukprot:gene4052-5074_t